MYMSILYQMITEHPYKTFALLLVQLGMASLLKKMIVARFCLIFLSCMFCRMSSLSVFLSQSKSGSTKC